MLPCHHVILVASVAVATSPGRESTRPRFCLWFFFGKQSVLIELPRNGVITWRQSSRSCGVFKSWISVAHCPFQRKWRVLHNYDISVLEQVCVLMGSPTWWRFSFCLSRNFVVFWWRDAPLVREFQMWGHRCKQWDSRWFQGRKMRFRGIRWTMSS